MTRIPSARRIPTACKTPNKHPVQHLPVSCVGGAQGKPLRWRVEEQPCHRYKPKMTAFSEFVEEATKWIKRVTNKQRKFMLMNAMMM